NCSFASKITRLNAMITALKAADAKITHHLPADFITDMDTRFQTILDLDATHEAIKSKLKETTVEIYTKLEELEEKFRYARNVVKLELPQESWLTYGCKAKR
ncbi:MAG TPA: hypothetical protein VHR47_06475, partial [Bacillota bacterium]|nr:hypothetical protein [Bacillota bacterium]